jgi:hypothetical protein
MPATRGEYKGNPTITLTPTGAKPNAKGVTVGGRKAQLIMRHVDAVIAFAQDRDVEENDLVSLGEYKGFATITLKAKASDTKGFTFGRTKAIAFTSNLGELGKFAHASESESESESESAAVAA